jgi:hypothetical protein
MKVYLAKAQRRKGKTPLRLCAFAKIFFLSYLLAALHQPCTVNLLRFIIFNDDEIRSRC